MMEDNGLLGSTPTPVEEPTVDENVDVDNPNITTTPPDGSQPVDAPTRPEYIPENFWDQTKGEINVEGMAKSYAEIRKAYNERNNDAPGESVEDYHSDKYFSEEGTYLVEGLEVSKDDPGLKAALEAAKEAGLGVKQAHTFIGKYLEGVKEFIPTAEPLDLDAEMGKLGENGLQTVQGIKLWVDGMKNSGEINDDVHAAILDLGKNAAGIKALDVLRQKTGELSLPVGQAITGTTTMSLQDWYAATYETHAETGESRDSYDKRMRDVGERLIGKGHGTFSGHGLGMPTQRFA